MIPQERQNKPARLASRDRVKKRYDPIIGRHEDQAKEVWCEAVQSLSLKGQGTL